MASATSIDHDGAYRTSAYGAAFRDGEFSGFDEMFPNISSGVYPDGPWRGTMLPDHGEVWSRSWQSCLQNGRVQFTIEGVALPYRLKKVLWLEADTVRLSYQAENLSDHPLHCIWAAHPLFVLEDGMELALPCCRSIVNVYGGQKYWGEYGQVHPWPISLDGRDLRVLDSANRCSNKYYAADALTQNTAVLRYPCGTAVKFSAPACEVPYLGIWTDEAGEDMACVAPEPCTGAFDTIEQAVKRNAVCAIPPGGKSSWSLQIQFSEL